MFSQPNPISDQSDAVDLRDESRREWLAAIAQGDEAALAELYDDCSAKVYGLALRITGNAAEAAEVTGDVYMKIWNCAERYDSTRSQTLTWILMMCRSSALDSLRRRDRAESHPDPDLLVVEREADNDPADLLMAMENSSALHMALTALSPLQRQLVSLAFFKGLTHQEIADHSKLPLGSVKSHLRKALEYLQSFLVKEAHDV